ncbi:MAG: TonB-dependent receptor [Bacteroidales bacterium]
MFLLKKFFNLVLPALLLMGVPEAEAQFTLSGIVVDKNTGDPLSGAHVVVDETYLATTTNADGYYSFRKISAGRHTIRVSFVGYVTIREEIQVTGPGTRNFELQRSVVVSDEVVVSATRAGDFVPTTHQTVTRGQIEKENLGQDLPYLIRLTPSVVVTSDAGTGIGYTGIRIRGTDLSRINVTVNGIPLNDAESHGVWFVNMPDFASSLESIQIQRGVGTSTNGAAAFGATLNMQTTTMKSDPYAEASVSAGSYNTLKTNTRFGTGLIDGRWTFDGRLSRITTDGYIDRAFSNLKSFWVSGGLYGNKSMLKLNIFSGKEKTYQAWNGVPKVRLNDDREGMLRYGEHYLYTEEEVEHMLNSDSRTYNFYTYENETDNYQQDHYQLLYTLEPAKNWYVNAALHYTRGRGYYEQYKKDEDFADYLISPVVIGSDTVSSTDLVRRKWLDNHFYGFTWSVQYDNHNRLMATLGGSWNRYLGDHYGKVIWARYASVTEPGYQWYLNTGDKSDLNIYGKVSWSASEAFRLFGDLQLRSIQYSIEGTHDDLRDLTQSHDYLFFNPKAGIYYRVNDFSGLYGSVAVAHREPPRSGFRDADPGEVPRPEQLIGYELGYNLKSQDWQFEANLFYMNYKDQLVLTGEINNVGDAIRVNVPESFRAGLEMAAGWKITSFADWQVNATFSRNRIKNFTAWVDNWDEGGQISTELGDTPISFSPDFTAGSNLKITVAEGFSASLLSQYVSRQYIDNTGSEDRSLDPWFVNDLLLEYKISTGFIRGIDLFLKVNNLFSELYESNAWVYRYYYQGQYWEMDGYFPQAPAHFLAGVTLRF